MPVSVDLPDSMRKELETKKDEQHYNSMSELIRDALREFLTKDQEELTTKESAALELIRDGQFKQVELSGDAEESMEKGLEELKAKKRE